MQKYNNKYPAISDLEARAVRRLPKFARDYLCGGIGDENGLRQNRQAFTEVNLVPRYMRDVSSCSMTTPLFGENYSMPVGISPVGMTGMIWPGAEQALANAAHKAGIPYVLSSVGTKALEDIAELTDGWAWFQLYPMAETAITSNLLSRAEASGYRVLVVTVDVPVGAKRDRDIRNGLCLPLRLTASNVWSAFTHPAWSLALLRHGLPRFRTLSRYAPPNMRSLGGMSEFISTLMAPGVSDDILQRIRDEWRGKLLIKGPLCAEDATKACEIGADGIIVSNHGGRLMDAAPATITVLPEIVKAVGKRCTVMVDSGVRCGTDVLRAIASGAACVFSGRSFMFGVAAMGSPGARQAIEIYRDEVHRGLAQLGCTDINQLDKRWLRQSETDAK